tara:strand:+ start:1159 stop:3093 length:1935 start_codon:yes stop_codon:yes gene_type:complete
MPTRPNQHKLEDLSRAKFQLVLPKRWVYRDKDKDYGIDGEVELFDQEDKAQGSLFYVQLKATGSKNESTILNVDFNIETLKYYKKLDVPVLLVRYSEFNDCFYVKWIYNVDLFFTKKDAKKIRIKLESENLWGDNTSLEIEKKLSRIKKLKSGYFNFPIPFSLEIKEDKIHNISKSILQTQIKKELKKYADILNFSQKDDSIIEVILDSEELKINLSDIAGCSFHSIELRENNEFSQGIAKDILLGLSTAMVQIGQIDYCGKIIFDYGLESRLIDKEELLVHMLAPLFKSSYFNHLLNLIEDILDRKKSIPVLIISTINILLSANTDNKLKVKAIERFHTNRLQAAIKTNDNHQIGTTYYNLGNHYRGQGQYYESTINYIAAKRYEPKYLNQDYYYSELAGVLFLLDKYKQSAYFYAKAVKLGAKGLTKALYADALMFSGEYQKALNSFHDYLQDIEEPKDEFLLKFLALEGVLKESGTKSQNRDYWTATRQACLSKIEKGLTPKQQLDKSLENDLLCGLAWFNYGIIQIEELDFDVAMFSFTMAGLVQSNDIEAWKNSTLCSINSKSGLAMLPLIIRTAYSFNGEEYLEQLFIELEKGTKNENISEFMEVIEKILAEPADKDAPPVVRVLNENGKFENIFREY